MRNPFEFGRELNASELVDRADELALVDDVFRSAGRLFLIGPRRYGKTSLLLAAAERAEKDGAVVLRFDAQAFPSIESLAARIAADAAHRLTPSIEKAGEALRKFFASVRPTLTIDPQENRWKVTLAGEPGRAEGPALLADLLDGVERLAKKASRPVAVVIDEFQEIVETGGADAEEQIRASIQRHRSVGYVFAGSRTRLLTEMVTDPSRPFHRLGRHLFLGPVPRADFGAFLERGFARAGIQVQSGAVDAILDAAEEVPYNVQLLAHACWERCRASLAPGGAQRPQPLTPTLVDETTALEARRLDPFYTQLWTSLTSTQRRALLALLREPPGTGFASTAVARRHGMPVTTLQRAIQALFEKAIVREESSGATVRLRLEDPLFGVWTRLVVP